MIRDLIKFVSMFVLFLFFLALIGWATDVVAKPPLKSKFYDFNEQIIDGEIKKPSTVYIDARQKARFERLLKLKKSFLPTLFKTSKYKVFK